MSEDARQEKCLRRAARLLVKHCPRLARDCYWAGTSVVWIEDLHHRCSFDLDFHTRRALQDTRPILAQIEQAFPNRFELLQAPDSDGSAFSGLLELPEGVKVPVQVLSNFENVPDEDLLPSRSVPGLHRVSLLRYLCDKIQCVVERAEARDLFDIRAVLDRFPELTEVCRGRVAKQDALLLAERLTGWTDDSIREDLKAYSSVEPSAAIRARDLLLAWLREDSAPPGELP